MYKQCRSEAAANEFPNIRHAPGPSETPENFNNSKWNDKLQWTSAQLAAFIAGNGQTNGTENEQIARVQHRARELQLLCLHHHHHHLFDHASMPSFAIWIRSTGPQSSHFHFGFTCTTDSPDTEVVRRMGSKLLLTGCWMYRTRWRWRCAMLQKATRIHSYTLNSTYHPSQWGRHVRTH